MRLILVLSLIQYFSGVFTRTLDEPQPFDLTEVTYPGIGHFTLKDFYDPVYRPFTLLPQSPEHINVKFNLYTRSNPKKANVQILKTDQQDEIKKSHFNPKNPTKFIVHGFMDNELFGDWMQTIKDEFLESADLNVVIVDWSGGNGLPYTQATANTRVVGPVIGLFIKDLKAATGFDESNAHILGHSLGSHVAGYAGKWMNGTLGRITGLDPAGPYYEGLPAAAKLAYTDAQFVDAIHTDANPLLSTDLGFGMYETSGHLDFYPNGGRQQPGCDTQRWTSIITDGLLGGIRKLVACNHQRAVDYYMASIGDKEAPAVAYQCADYDSYSAGKCIDCGEGEKCAILGEHAINMKTYEKTIQSSRYFLETTDKLPFFKQQFEIQLKMAAEADKRVANHGTVVLTLHGSKGDVKVTLNDKDQIFHLGETYTFMKEVDSDPGEVKSVTFHWHKALGAILKDDMWVDSIHVVPMSSVNVMDKEKHLSEMKTFCAATRDSALVNEKDYELATACN